MTRFLACLIRRVAGPPGPLARSLTVLMALAAAALSGGGPAGGARAVDPACPVAGHTAFAAPFGTVSDAQAHIASSDRACLDCTGVCAIDFEASADLGLPHPTMEASRHARMSAAFFRPVSDEIPRTAPGGSPRRPPRVA